MPGWSGYVSSGLRSGFKSSICGCYPRAASQCMGTVTERNAPAGAVAPARSAALYTVATLTARGLADANVIFSAPPRVPLDPIFRKPQLCQTNPHPARPRYPPPPPRTPPQPPRPRSAHTGRLSPRGQTRRRPPAHRAPPTLATSRPASARPPRTPQPTRPCRASTRHAHPAPTSSGRPVPRPQQPSIYPARPPPSRPSAASAGRHRHRRLPLRPADPPPGRPPGSATPQPPITHRALSSRLAEGDSALESLTNTDIARDRYAWLPELSRFGSTKRMLCRRQQLNPEHRRGVSRKLTGA